MDELDVEFIKIIKFLYKKHKLDIEYNIYTHKKEKVTDEYILQASKGFISSFTEQVKEYDDEDRELMKIFGYFV